MFPLNILLIYVSAAFLLFVHIDGVYAASNDFFDPSEAACVLRSIERFSHRFQHHPLTESRQVCVGMKGVFFTRTKMENASGWAQQMVDTHGKGPKVKKGGVRPISWNMADVLKAELVFKPRNSWTRSSSSFKYGLKDALRDTSLEPPQAREEEEFRHVITSLYICHFSACLKAGSKGGQRLAMEFLVALHNTLVDGIGTLEGFTAAAGQHQHNGEPTQLSKAGSFRKMFSIKRTNSHKEGPPVFVSRHLALGAMVDAGRYSLGVALTRNLLAHRAAIQKGLLPQQTAHLQNNGRKPTMMVVLDLNAIVRDAFHLQAKVDELSAEIKEKSAAGHVPRLPFSEVLDKWAKVTITEHYLAEELPFKGINHALHSLVYHPSDIPLKLEISEERVSQFLEKVLGLSAGISTVKASTYAERMEQIGTMDSGDPDLDTLVGTFVAVKMSQPAVESLEHLIDQLLSEDDGGTVVADHLHGQRHPSKPLTPPRELFYNLMVVHLCETFVASNFFDKKFVTKPFSIALSKKSVARLVEKFNHGLEKLGTLTGGERKSVASVAAYVALAEAIRPDLQAHVALAQSLPKHGKELNHAIKEYLDDEKRMLEKAIGLEFDRNEERHSIAKFLSESTKAFATLLGGHCKPPPSPTEPVLAQNTEQHAPPPPRHHKKEDVEDHGNSSSNKKLFTFGCDGAAFDELKKALESKPKRTVRWRNAVV